jgi:hypothetical protein
MIFTEQAEYATFANETLKNQTRRPDCKVAEVILTNMVAKIIIRFCLLNQSKSILKSEIEVLRNTHRYVRFTSFSSGGFTIAALVNIPDGILVNPTVHCAILGSLLLNKLF